MNQWVYDGFATTYKNLGVDFDCFTMKARPIYGKDVVQIGLEKVFLKRP
jgi:arginyl-tRNA synthetase